ncbi:MAG: DUF655 domain-containing protein [Candidatus Aenigmatarchaeota archaeon]
MTFFKDNYLIVLDFLPRGHATGKMEPIAQGIGENFFSLLEVCIKKDVIVKQGDRLYIGPGERKEVEYIKRRISAKDLTNIAHSALPEIVEKIIKNNEKRFVDFFNNAKPITTRMHQLELLHGIGKKYMWNIIEEREKGPFTSFEDIKKRLTMIPDPVELLKKRILQEIESEDEKYYLFVIKPQKRFE